MSTSPWLPITRDHPDVLGIDPADDGRLEVQVTLSTVPPIEWADRFTAEADSGTPAPTVKGKTVTVRPPDDELEGYVADLDRRLADANQHFESEVLPEVDAQLTAHQQEDAEEIHDRDEDGRVRAARLRAQGL